MSRIQTQNQLQDYLDAELGWRVKEISNLKSAVKRSEYVSEQTLTRASLALLYAHWEGFVKNAATSYVEYVNNQGLKYTDLATCFVVLGFKKNLHELKQSKQGNLNIQAMEFIRAELNSKSQLKIETAINTESNLNSGVLKNILETVGLNFAEYETKSNLIDESLLKRRNNIAHGEYIDIKKMDWAVLADEVITLLRQFKTDIENAMAQSSFKRAPDDA